MQKRFQYINRVSGCVLVTGALTIILSATVVEAATRYATPSGQTSGSCDTWGNACTLSYALSGASAGDEVWATSGTYDPISLVNGVKVIGGFAGSETAASQSDPGANVSIIDGDGARAVLSEDSGGSTVLRGFTIKNGRATGFTDFGGGLLMIDSAAMIVQCIFEDNTADIFGGAVGVRDASAAQFVNCIFRHNGAVEIGGSTVNTLGGGGAFIHSGSATFTNCLFHGNKAGDGGAIALADGSATLNNCTIALNEATINAGGGLFDQEGAATVKGCIFWGNTAAKSGAQILNFPNRTTTVSKSDVQSGFTGTGNIDSDPLFTNSGSGDFTLQSSSPCKDKLLLGDLPTDVTDLDWDTVTSEKIPLDLKLENRRINVMADMGCYESQQGSGGGGGAQ